MSKSPKQFKSHQLWYRLSLSPQILELATEEEKTHAEAALRKRGVARQKLNHFRLQRANGGQPMYQAEFWDAHNDYNQADQAIRGFRAICRLRYGRSLEPGLYRSIKPVFGKEKCGMFGKGRGHWTKRNGLLMWIERDEFGDNWFLDLKENKTIMCIRGSALQCIVPVPPELLTEEEQK